jgi:hypothetical protein
MLIDGESEIYSKFKVDRVSENLVESVSQTDFLKGQAQRKCSAFFNETTQ